MILVSTAPSLGWFFSNSRLEYREKEFKNLHREENNELVNTNDTMSLPVICKYRAEEFCFYKYLPCESKVGETLAHKTHKTPVTSR